MKYKILLISVIFFLMISTVGASDINSLNNDSILMESDSIEDIQISDSESDKVSGSDYESLEQTNLGECPISVSYS